MYCPRDIDQLKQHVTAGCKPGYVFFLRPEVDNVHALGAECLSQWYPSPMVLEGHCFPTAEHYMMWRKARLFGDGGTEVALLANDNPSVAKQLGRQVKNFDQDVWIRHRFEVVVSGSLAKFVQNVELGMYLLGTGGQVLAEASPVDYVWGIGLAADDAGADNPLLWKGQNLLGFALMRVRARLGSTAKAEGPSSP